MTMTQSSPGLVLGKSLVRLAANIVSVFLFLQTVGGIFMTFGFAGAALFGREGDFVTNYSEIPASTLPYFIPVTLVSMVLVTALFGAVTYYWGRFSKRLRDW